MKVLVGAFNNETVIVFVGRCLLWVMCIAIACDTGVLCQHHLARADYRDYCTVLYCTVLYCTVLYCTVLYCSVLSPTTQPTCPSPACCRQSSSGSSWSPWTHCTCTHTSPVNSGIQLLSASSPTWSGRSRGWSSRTPGGCVPTAPSPSRASSWCRPPRSAPHLGPPWSCTKL